jgi:hypothetical protein
MSKHALLADDLADDFVIERVGDDEDRSTKRGIDDEPSASSSPHPLTAVAQKEEEPQNGIQHAPHVR